MLVENKTLLLINMMRAKGFSLVEVMIVIAIIGILSVIAIAAISSVRKRARQTEAFTIATDTISDCIQCTKNNGKVNVPVLDMSICSDTAVGNWPELPRGYQYNFRSSFSPPEEAGDRYRWLFSISTDDLNEIAFVCNVDGCVDCKSDCAACVDKADTDKNEAKLSERGKLQYRVNINTDRCMK